VDVGNTQQVNDFVAKTVSELGKIDFVFNCAGVNPTSIPLEDTTDAYWDKLVNTNLKGVFLVIRACLPHLHRGSAIVNVSSISGIRGSALQSVYCTTKFGLIGMSKSLALELGPRGIRVNCVAPGYIDTPTNAGIVKGGEAVERMRTGNALERLGTPEEVADVVTFLFGEGSRYMNGAVVEIDGAIKMTSTTSKL
jgi:NAD(P)-dependent dehydrogenase (short-subunit alcohol dehydrogenase family)